MKPLLGLVFILSIAGCSTCKSTDSPEVCRTKQRDHMQRHPDSAAVLGVGKSPSARVEPAGCPGDRA